MKRPPLIFLCTILFFITGSCTSRVARLEKQLELGQQNEAKLLEKIENMKGEVEACKTINQSLTENLQKLSGQSQKLKADIDKQRSVLKLQDQVIKLLDDTKQSIELSLKEQIAARGIEVKQAHDQIRVVLVDNVLFDSGSVDIKSEGKKMLLILAETLRTNKTNQIIVQGHTDNIPPGPSLRKRFPSNWELSAARAAAVVRFLQREGKLDPDQLSLKAYGSTEPVASNETEEGRMQNRRIEIVLDHPD